MSGQLVPRIETSTVNRPTLRSRANPRSFILTRRVNARGPRGNPGTGGSQVHGELLVNSQTVAGPPRPLAVTGDTFPLVITLPTPSLDDPGTWIIRNIISDNPITVAGLVEGDETVPALTGLVVSLVDTGGPATWVRDGFLASTGEPGGGGPGGGGESLWETADGNVVPKDGKGVQTPGLLLPEHTAPEGQERPLVVDDDGTVAVGAVNSPNGIARLDGDGTLPDVLGPSTWARDSEVAAAITTHAGAVDPHGDRAYAAGLVDDLSGVTDASTARTNLGLGSLATLSTVTSAQIVDGTIVDADIGAGAAIALSKLAVDPLARGNHTGTQAQSTVTGLVSDLAGKAAVSHVHAGGDITSGTVGTARLGSGTADATTFLRGDQTWAVPSGGMPSIASQRILGRVSAGSGAAEELTRNQVLSMVALPGTPSDATVGSWQSVILGIGHMGAALATTVGNACVTTHLTPVYVGRRTRFDRIACHLSTAATDAGAVLELGICPAVYSEGNRPDITGIVSYGTVAATGSAGLRSITIDQWLDPGLYWLLTALSTGGTFSGTNPVGYYTNSAYLLGTTDPSGNGWAYVFRLNRTTSNGSLTGGHTLGTTGITGYLRTALRVSEVA